MTDRDLEYDVALSFAGAQRDYVELVAKELKSVGVSVFYDEDMEARLWGRNLIDELLTIYRDQAFRVVMFISREYVDGPWPNHERKAALERLLTSPDPYVLPVRFDDTVMPGLPSSVAYLNAGRTAPGDIAVKIAEHLQHAGRITGEPSEEYRVREDQARRVSVGGILDDCGDGNWKLRYTVTNGSDYPLQQSVVVVNDPGRVGSPVDQQGTAVEVVCGVIGAHSDVTDVAGPFPMEGEPAFGELTTTTYLLFVDHWDTCWFIGPGVFQRSSHHPRVC